MSRKFLKELPRAHARARVHAAHSAAQRMKPPDRAYTRELSPKEKGARVSLGYALGGGFTALCAAGPACTRSYARREHK